MKKISAIVNQKGGVGKSTTTVNLGACLAYLGYRILLIDIDPQGNATSGVGIEKTSLEYSIYDLLINEVEFHRILKKTKREGLDILPANIDLAGAEIELVSAISREHRLKNTIGTFIQEYDYILIDCPPSLGLLTLNALTASHAALVPIQCEYYALEGLSQLMTTIQLVKKNLNSRLQLEGVILTMCDFRTNLSQNVIDEVKNFFKDDVFHTIIPRNIRLSEAPSHGLPIIDYDRDCKGAQAYLELAKEVMGN